MTFKHAKRTALCFGTLGFLLSTWVATASADPKLRAQVNQNGDFALIGNTLGYDCGPNTPAPVVGIVGASCGNNVNDTAPDVFWRSADQGDARANLSIQPSQARSTAVLVLPAGATVTHAYLYWGASGPLSQQGVTTATFERPGAGGFSQTVTAIDAWGAQDNVHLYYQSVADVTAIVQAQRSGPYRVGGLAVDPFQNVKEEVAYAGWSLVVFYQKTDDPPRNLSLFDGLDTVYYDSVAHDASVKLSGFLVPNSGFDGKLGIISYEGDDYFKNDQLLFGQAPLTSADALGDAANPSDNFFNGTRSWLGSPVSVAGDLPQLTGGAGSMSGIDLDVVDITSKLHKGQTSADITAHTGGDMYLLGAFVTSIATYQPVFATSTKEVEDVNGGAVRPGDVLEYTLNIVNTGNDTATNLEVRDPLPAGVTYKSGTIRISSGPGTGPKTDPADSDQCEYDSTKREIHCRIGNGATASQGGSLAVGKSVTVKFQVTIDAGANGSIENQALIKFEGQQGAPETETPTDGNGPNPGAPATVIAIDECVNDQDCANAQLPRCDTVADPNACVQCIVNADCSGATPACSPQRTCIACQTDDDCADNTPACQASGECAECSATNSTMCKGVTPVCDASAGKCVGCNDDADCQQPKPTCDKSKHECICVATGPEVCGNQVDEDCDGQLDNGCGDADNDGLSDGQEKLIGTDPHDADSDDDGVIDGEEVDSGDDTDGDGLINALDPDSDDDGLFDGTEMGKDCSNPATNTSLGHCRADGDQGATTTNPLKADTDGGGANDGSEDANLNGVVDSGEQDPTAGHAADDKNVEDHDGDGLSDALEKFLGSDPSDADTDDDGVLDGAEANPSDDTDGDHAVNVLDVDSDNDGLLDGTEVGNDCENPATSKFVDNCKADEDKGKTSTSPVLADTDGGGVSDGSEDVNLNGVVDSGETDPTKDHADDDGNNADTDKDGLSDALEKFLGSDPNDADSDDDGVLDGAEANPSIDTDDDGKKNVNDEDSDGDGLMDGTELGLGCDEPATDNSKGNCIADADQGKTQTSPVLKDTDHGSVFDGDEDANHNGMIDTGERDPNNGADDLSGQECSIDADCGGTTSGMVCDENECVAGCRGQNGNGCPTGQQCTSQDETIGQCIQQDGGVGGSAGSAGAAGNAGTAGSGGSDSDAGVTTPVDNVGVDTLEGGGCACSVPSEGGNGSKGVWTGLGLVGLWLASRRRRSSR